jgi:hypothetical protein
VKKMNGKNIAEAESYWDLWGGGISASAAAAFRKAHDDFFEKRGHKPKQFRFGNQKEKPENHASTKDT